MKQIFKDKIINIDSNIIDNKFLIKKLNYEKNITSNSDIEVIFLGDLLEKRKNFEMLEKSKSKPATWGNVYSPKDELEIFQECFDNAIKNNKKIHIVWVTLWKEIEILEEYYKKLWFFAEDINAFKVDFSKVLVSVSVKIENLMWRGSDYKRMWKDIFFNPPIRESWEVKNMFKWINRWVTAGIYIKNFSKEKQIFLQEELKQEHILPIIMAKILNYNLSDFGFEIKESDFIIEY